MTKFICEECGWHGTDSLTAPNPFDPEDVIVGCPDCKEVNSLLVACDEPGCWQRVTCGTPTPHGYRSTCHAHWPKGA